MNSILTEIVSLLVIAIIVALIARRMRLPYTVGLVAIGAVLAVTRVTGGIVLTHDFIFDFILPPLLFEAAINIYWRDLRRDALPVLTLAIFGTLISAGIVTLCMTYGLGWPVRSAALFGILIAATDPVAVIAMFKDNGITGRLRLLTESESLFNDGVAAVLFVLALTWAQQTSAQQPMPSLAAQTLLVTVGGGIFVGFTWAAVALAAAGQTSDHLIESALTTVTAYGSFLLAEHFHFSGVLATITSGLLVGNFGILAEDHRSRISSVGRDFILALWEFIAFIANSLVFLLIGVAVERIPYDQLGIAAVGLAIGIVLLARALAVYPLCLLFAKSRWLVSLSDQHVLWWGGLRGALGLALALALPISLPYRSEILIATFSVVAFSVLVQGLTMPILLRILAFTP